MKDNKKKLALFVDYNNIWKSLDKTQKDFLNPLIDIINNYGIVVVGKMYISVPKRTEYICNEKTEIFYKYFEKGIEPVFTPSFNGKSLGDPLLICDCMEILYEKSEINMFVLVSSDKDIIPLIRQIAKKGKEILVIGVHSASSEELINEVNRLGFKYIRLEDNIDTYKKSVNKKTKTDNLFIEGKVEIEPKKK